MTHMASHNPTKGYSHSSYQRPGEHPSHGHVPGNKPPGEYMVKDNELSSDAERDSVITDQTHHEIAVNDRTNEDCEFGGLPSVDQCLEDRNVSVRFSSNGLCKQGPSNGMGCAEVDPEIHPAIFLDCIRPGENISCNKMNQGICITEDNNSDIKYYGELSMGGLSVFSAHGFNTNSNAMSDRIMKLSQEEAMAADLLTDSEMQSKIDRLKEDRDNILSKTNLLLTWNFIQLVFLLGTIFYACVCVCNFRQSFSCADACMWKGRKEKSAKKWWSF